MKKNLIIIVMIFMLKGIFILKNIGLKTNATTETNEVSLTYDEKRNNAEINNSYLKSSCVDNEKTKIMNVSFPGIKKDDDTGNTPLGNGTKGKTNHNK